MNNLSRYLTAIFLLVLSLVFLMVMGWINLGLVWGLLGTIVVFIFLQQKQYRQNLLTISILGFLTGWRGLHILPSFIIYPTELFIWLGLLIYLVDQRIKSSNTKQSKPVFWSFALAFWGLSSGILSVLYGQPLLDILIPLKSFLVFIPMLILFRNWIQDKSQIISYARTLVYVGIVISVLGLLERYVPAISSMFSKYMPAPIETRYNFELGSAISLAAFSSWGTPVVSTLLVLFVGLAVFMPKPQVGWQKIIGFLALPVLILAIISTGYRSAWLGLVLVIVLSILFNREQVFSWLVLVIPGIVVFFSSAYLDRLKTLFFITNAKDPTIITRSLALQQGLVTIQTNWLFGTGWNSPTTFNDWVNIGVRMGILGLFAFAIWYGLLLYKLIKYAKKSKEREGKLLYMAFFAALSGYSIAMVSGAMSQVFPIMTGFWFVFCLAWRLTEISEQEKQVDGKIVRVVAHL